jgi:16S rRNA (uracil1498-N3)-methyltransferase
MVPRLLVADLRAAGQPIMLEADQAHYALRVLRLRPGDPVELFDGTGGRWSARMVAAGRDSARLELVAPLPACPESPLRLTLAQGISAADRMDITIEKAVELGVAAIVPLQTERSVVRLDEARAQRRMAHWRRVIVAAAMQCGRDRLPALAEPLPLADWLAGRPAVQPGWVLDPRADASLAAQALRLPADAREASLLVGPESGLSPDEIARARQAGLAPARLGPRVLRTETAGLAALAVLQALRGDLGGDLGGGDGRPAAQPAVE